jgi:hypothetical protein
MQFREQTTAATDIRMPGFRQGDRVVVGRRKATVICEVPIGFVAIRFDSAHGKWSTAVPVGEVRHMRQMGKRDDSVVV